MSPLPPHAQSHGTAVMRAAWSWPSICNLGAGDRREYCRAKPTKPRPPPTAFSHQGPSTAVRAPPGARGHLACVAWPWAPPQRPSHTGREEDSSLHPSGLALFPARVSTISPLPPPLQRAGAPPLAPCPNGLRSPINGKGDDGSNTSTARRPAARGKLPAMEALPAAERRGGEGGTAHGCSTATSPRVGHPSHDGADAGPHVHLQ